MNNGNQSDKDIFTAIREAHPLTEYCAKNGINLMRVGTTYRARSPFTDAGNAFCVNDTDADMWHDFSVVDMPKHGDVLELCAYLHHNGDKRAALKELAPEGYSRQITQYMKDKEQEQAYIHDAHDRLVNGLMKGRYSVYQHLIPYLHSRGLDDEQIRRLKIGFDVNGFRLLIPRLNFDGVEVLYHKTRRMPNAEGRENENEEKYKCAYIGKGEKRNHFLRNVPLGLHTLSRGGRFLVLCEGDFDTLNFEREGFAVLGSGGGAFTREAWPVILSIAENFEEVVLAFDADDAGVSYSQSVAQSLFEHKIPFRVVSLPEQCKDVNDFYREGGNLHSLVEDATTGLEYLALQFIPPEGFQSLTRGKKRSLQENLKAFLLQAKRGGADNPDLVALCQSLSEAFPATWIAEILEQAKKGQSEAEIVDALSKKYTLMFNEKTGFYEHDNDAGIWVRRDDVTIGAYIRAYLGATSSARKIYSITEHLKRAVVSDAPLSKLNRNPLFAFRNGTLHFNGEGNSIADLFRPADPADYVTSRKAFDFNPDAKCPEWVKALRVIMANDEKRIMCFQEFCGYALLPHCRFHKALYMRGRGRNGKSTLLNVIRAIFGSDNATSLEPSDFADKFSLVFLKDALINICTDAKPDIAGAEANLKKAIAGEPLNACYKLKDIITFRPRAKIFFACNHDLDTKDKTQSMLERFLLIDFPVHFVDEPETGNDMEAKKDLNIEDVLMQELSGIFNWCVEGAKRLIKQGHFTLTDEQAKIEAAFKSPIDSVMEFYEQFARETFKNYPFENFPVGITYTRGESYARYCDFCEAEGIDKPVDVSRFHKVFRKALADNHIPFTEKQTHEGTRSYAF